MTPSEKDHSEKKRQKRSRQENDREIRDFNNETSFSEGKPFDALSLLSTTKLSEERKDRYIKDARGDEENEHGRVKQLRDDGIFVKSKFFGKFFDFITNFFDSLIWWICGSDVEKATRAEQKKTNQKDLKKKYQLSQDLLVPRESGLEKNVSPSQLTQEDLSVKKSDLHQDSF